ncbi:PhoH family protein [Clostridium cellulovorans]|uniref:PhoH family protein n=1 Tax=Clostridium cellulovorans (strain ATCC 35296 / DSM 3052 / OCM 3 / 743B) TaxID=573061 RepID=D9SUA6_CLOC7|nr:PhoH family protein [Clostridium cellulovorans]ADL52861.1 PhoH family protein [Clostridium cellulovorans 743B]
MKKNYVIDTNVMIHDPNFYNNFEDNNIIIPIICLEELDNMKKESSIRGYNARTVLKNINKLKEACDGNLSTGIPLPSGGSLRIEINRLHNYKLPDSMYLEKNDNKIIAVTKSLSIDNPNMKTILVTKDIAVSIKANSLGIEVQDYKNDHVEVETLYKGVLTLFVPSDFIARIYNDEIIELDELKDFLRDENGDYLLIHPNQFVILKAIEDEKTSAITKCELDDISGKKFLKHKNVDNLKYKGFLIKPRNLEQKLTLNLLMDDDIPFVTISGRAGCGKTILAMCVALEKLEKGVYDKIVLVRPTSSAGEDIGYLPGTEDEKLKPWMGPFYDAIENILRLKGDERTAKEFIDGLKKSGLLEIKTFTYMRGRTISNAIVLYDEAQETTPHIAKLMLTRIGVNAKIIMTGDPSDNQIDNTHVNSKTNGLVYVIERCKESNLTAHVELQKVERSALAELMNRVL